MKTCRLWIFRVLLSVLTLVVIGTIFYRSSLDAVASGEESSRVLGLVQAFFRSLGLDLTITDHLIRKLAHFAEYFVLGALLSATVYAYLPRRSRVLEIGLPAGAVIAVCDELIQLTAEGRSCEVRDMLLDFSAVLCAALIFVLIIWLLIDRRKVSR